MDEVTADLVLAVLFDNNDRDGKPCLCSCHPRLADRDLHDSGFDCSCTWSEDRREAEHREWLAALEDFESSSEGRELRERHGQWRIELDLEPIGQFVGRLVGTGPDGEMLTEPVETKQGEVIAEGAASALGDTAIAHLEFIVRTIREHITGERCQHLGAISFCPTCGARV